MIAKNHVPIASLAEVNPSPRGHGLSPDAVVSFIPMSDVSEAGQWVTRQRRRLREIGPGYTPFAEGDVLFAKITPCMENGKGAHAVGLENGIGFGSTEFHVLRARSPNSARFIFHWLQTPMARRRAIAYMGGSAGQQRVQPEFFAHFAVPEIKPEAQHRIAAVLDTVDAAIAQTEAVIAKLKSVRAGLLHDLLTRGILSETEANGLPAEASAKAGQLRPSPDQAPRLYKDSPLGNIPREWEVRVVEDVCELGRGRVISNLDLEANPGLYPVYSSQSANEGVFGYLGTYDFEGDYVTWTTDGANAGTVFLRQGRFNCTNVCGTLKSRGGILAAYLAMALAPRTKKHVSYVGNPKLMNNIMAKIAIPVPKSLDEQGAAVNQLRVVDLGTSAEQAEVAKLRSLKSGLMSDLLTGRVQVPEGVRQ